MLSASEKVFAALKESELLLKQDKTLPNVVTILTGERLSTSWWSHPKAHLIFRVLSELSDHPDVLVAKFLFGKDTLIHRSLWPAFLAIVTADQPWQRSGLSGAARALLSRVNKNRTAVSASGTAAKELVSKLLVHTTEVHTESGKHELAVTSWQSWRAGAHVGALPSYTDGVSLFESASKKIGAPSSALPWF